MDDNHHIPMDPIVAIKGQFCQFTIKKCWRPHWVTFMISKPDEPEKCKIPMNRACLLVSNLHSDIYLHMGNVKTIQ